MADMITAFGWVTKLAAKNITVDARETKSDSGVWGISENNGPLMLSTHDMPHRIRKVLAQP